jgi:zona occludens toxin (predicted ATPase)
MSENVSLASANISIIVSRIISEKNEISYNNCKLATIILILNSYCIAVISAQVSPVLLGLSSVGSVPGREEAAGRSNRLATR